MLEEGGYLAFRKDPQGYMAMLEHNARLTALLRKRAEEELQWLRESMQRDMLPDWLIEMVCEQWNRKASE